MECQAYCKVQCWNEAKPGHEYCGRCLERHYEYKQAFASAINNGLQEFTWESNRICVSCRAMYPQATQHECKVHKCKVRTKTVS